MLVYIVGMQELKNGEAEYDPYYFGYTTDQKMANKYYQYLIDKDEKSYSPSAIYASMYFIQKISSTKFEEFKREHHLIIDEIQEYDGVCMTESDFGTYMDMIMEDFDYIHSMLNDGKDLPETIKRISEFSKFLKNNKLRKNAKILKLLLKYMRSFFEDYNEIEKIVDWKRVHRKL